MKKLIVTITGVAALLLAGLGTYRAFSGPSRADTTFSKSDALEKAGELTKDDLPVLAKRAGELTKDDLPVLAKPAGELDKVDLPVLGKAGAELDKTHDLGVLFGG